MDLKQFLKTLPSEAERREFAESCGTTLGHMRNCIYDAEKALSVPVCVQVEIRSKGVVTREELRSDWADNWPELARRRRTTEKAGA